MGLGETPPVGLLGLGETPHVGLLGLGETPHLKILLIKIDNVKSSKGFFILIHLNTVPNMFLFILCEG